MEILVNFRNNVCMCIRNTIRSIIRLGLASIIKIKGFEKNMKLF